MANRVVKFDIEAVDKTGDGFDSANDELESAGDNASNAGLRFTELNSAIQIGQQILQTGQQIYQQTVDVFLDYANTVRTLRDITGESSEEISRVIQLTDDYKISSENLTIVQKKLATQGMSLNIDTLARMSDEYLALNSGADRQLYLTENLGREGADYAEILRQGSAAIRDQAAAVDAALILNDQALQSARDLEIAQDNLNDSWQAFIMQIGPGLTEALTGVVNGFNDMARANEILAEQGVAFGQGSAKVRRAAIDQAIAEREAAEATRKLSDNQQLLIDSTGKTADALSSLNEKELAQIASWTTLVVDFTTKQNDLYDELMTAERDLINARSQGYSETGEKIQGYLGKVNDIKAQIEEVKQAEILKTNTVILGYMQEKLAADGYLTDDEKLWLIEKGVEMGVYSETAIQAYKDAQQAALDYINGIPTTATLTVNVNYAGGTIGEAELATGIDLNGNGVIGAATGFSGIVPEGFNRDNMRFGVSSGEKVEITPSSRVFASEKNGQGGGSIQINVNGAGNADLVADEVMRRLRLQGAV